MKLPSHRVCRSFGFVFLGGLLLTTGHAYAVTSSSRTPEKGSGLVDSRVAGKAESDISLRRLRAGHISNEQSLSFLRKVERLREKHDRR